MFFLASPAFSHTLSFSPIFFRSLLFFLPTFIHWIPLSCLLARLRNPLILIVYRVSLYSSKCHCALENTRLFSTRSILFSFVTSLLLQSSHFLLPSSLVFSVNLIAFKSKRDLNVPLILSLTRKK